MLYVNLFFCALGRFVRLISWEKNDGVGAGVQLPFFFRGFWVKLVIINLTRRLRKKRFRSRHPAQIKIPRDFGMMFE